MPAKKAKRADGRYQTSLTLGRNEQGKPIKKFFYGETQREAYAKKKAYIEQSERQYTGPDIPLSKWCEEWHNLYCTGGFHHRADTASILSVFGKSLGENLVLSEIRPKDIQSYAKQIGGNTKSYVDKARRILQSMFQAAVENGYIAKNPCEGIQWSYVKTGTHKALEPYMIDLITNHWQIHNAGTWAMLMLYAGLRPSEALALRRENITPEGIHVVDGSGFENGELVVHPGKTKTKAGERVIPIFPPLRPVLDALPSEGFVCRNADGGPVTHSAYRRNWECFWGMLEQIHNGRNPQRLGRRTDLYPADWQYLPKVDKYDLRHTFCSMLYDADVDVKTAQYLMGHSTLDMTLKIYTHLSDQKKQRSYDKIFAYFSGNTEQPESQDVNQDVKNPETPYFKAY